jgi:hypothetical protein
MQEPTPRRPRRERVPGTFHRRAKVAAHARWSNPNNRRVIRLDELDSDTARLVRALMAQDLAKGKAEDAA